MLHRLYNHLFSPERRPATGVPPICVIYFGPEWWGPLRPTTINKRRRVTSAAETSGSAVQNGSVSIRKWGKQLRRISWLKQAFFRPIRRQLLLQITALLGCRIYNHTNTRWVRRAVFLKGSGASLVFHWTRSRQPLLGSHVLCTGVGRGLGGRRTRVPSNGEMCFCWVWFELTPRSGLLCGTNRSRGLLFFFLWWHTVNNSRRCLKYRTKQVH